MAGGTQPLDDEQDLNQSVPSDEEYEHLLEDYGQLTPLAEGELIKGHIVSINAHEALVDIGHKLEGLVPLEQLRLPDGTLVAKAGDTIGVMVDRSGPAPEGYILLSYTRAARLRVWDELEEAMRTGRTLLGRVTEVTRGGLTAEVGGIPCFLPGSHVDSRPIHDLNQFVGQEIPVRVIKVNRRRGAVVSRKLAVEQEQKQRREQILENIFEGAEVVGTIKNLTDYGAFVDLGGIDGLLHVSDMSHGRVGKPSEMVQVGQEVTVKVLKFDKEKQRISLGIRQLSPDPWENLPDRYPLGSRVIGRVMSVTDYGAFVQIESGVEGLIHISEMTWSRRMKHPSKVVKAGDEVEAVVLELKPKERRVSLGIKQLEADPWTTVGERYSIGSVVEGRVRKLADFGAFLEIEDGVDGLVHVSDLSWTKRVKHPSEVLKKGQMMQAVILNIDAGNRRLSLGVKQLQPDAWESFFRTHEVGDLVRGRVCRSAAFGVFVELAPGVEALCHRSEIPPLPGASGDAPLPIGDEYDFKVIKMNEADKKIGLSLRAVAEDEERTRLEDYQRQAAAATLTIEEAIQKRGDR